MSHKEVIGKFVSFELMIKDSKHIVNLEQGAMSHPVLRNKAGCDRSGIKGMLTVG
jgi:hypothetical protein